MRYLDMVHEEGTFACKSDNGLIDVNFTVIHPELILEDNSILMFEEVDGYYDMIGDADLYEMYNNNIILDNLLVPENSLAADTVSGLSYKGFDVMLVMTGVLRGHKFCYIQRKDANPIAEAMV